jgi:hypothetical protein
VWRMRNGQRTLVCQLVQARDGWACHVSVPTELLFSRNCADESDGRLIARNMRSYLRRTGWKEGNFDSVLRACIKTSLRFGASRQRPDHFPAATFAFNSSNQFCTTIMPAGGVLPSLEPAFSLIIRKRCPSGDTS